MINIVPIEREHLERLVELEQDCFSIPWTYKMFEEELESPRVTYYVALDGNEIIAYGGMWKIIDEGHITNIAVKSSHRRRGIASMLLEKLISVAKGYQLTMLTLEVRRSNLAAISLYKLFDFQEEGLRIGYYSDNNEDAIIMTRRDE